MWATTSGHKILSEGWVRKLFTCSETSTLTSLKAPNPLGSIREARKILVVLYERTGSLVLVPSEHLGAEGCRCRRGVGHGI